MRFALVVCLVAGCATSEIGIDAGPIDAADEVDAAPTVDSAPVPDAAPPDADSCAAGGTADDCCGMVCPGFGQPGAAPACETGGCVFRCDGENYDVNGLESDGCEESDAPTGNHTTGGAIDLGSLSCDDGASAIDQSGVVVSDAREHVPAIGGFQASTGAAPDQFKVHADGGLCVNDLNLSLSVTGSSSPLNCYQLAAVTSAGTYTCTTNSSGTCAISNGASSYGDNTNIVFTVRKSCSTGTVLERVTYRITGHL